MSWKNVLSEITVEKAPRETLAPELEVALRHAKDLLAAKRNLAVAEARAKASASKVPAEHAFTFIEKNDAMHDAHVEWEKKFIEGHSPDTHLQFWNDNVRY